MPKNPPQNIGLLKNVNAGFRQTSAGIKLGKTLFDPNLQKSISPSQISSLLRQAGVPVPKEAQVTADVAQIIMSGGVFVSGIEAGAEIAQLANPTTAVMRAVMDILAVTGLINANSTAAKLIGLAFTGALVVAAGGMNVLADIAFVLDCFFGTGLSNIFLPDYDFEKAMRENQKANLNLLKDWYAQKVSAEGIFVAKQFGNYQEGKLSIFQLMGGIAENAPEIFTNYFPDMKSFVTPITLSQSARSYKVVILKEAKDKNGIWNFYLPTPPLEASDLAPYINLGAKVNVDSSDGILPNTRRIFLTVSQIGPGNEAEFNRLTHFSKVTYVENSITYDSIKNDHKTLQNAFFEKYIFTPFAPYKIISSYSKNDLRKFGYPENAKTLGVFDHDNPVSRIKISDLAILSMLPPYFDFFHDDFDIKPLLVRMGLTPNDMGYSVVKDELGYRAGGDFSKSSTLKDPAYTINGVDYYDPPARDFNRKYSEINHELSESGKADSRGDIVNLIKSPKAERVITEWGIMPFLSGSMENKFPGTYSNLPITSKMGYRNIRNYWSAVSMVSFMLKDPYFKDYCNPNLFYQFIESEAGLQKRHSHLQFLSVARQLNKKAAINIASFFGKQPSEIKIIPGQPGQLTKVE